MTPELLKNLIDEYAVLTGIRHMAWMRMMKISHMAIEKTNLDPQLEAFYLEANTGPSEFGMFIYGLNRLYAKDHPDSGKEFSQYTSEYIGFAQ